MPGLTAAPPCVTGSPLAASLGPELAPAGLWRSGPLPVSRVTRAALAVSSSAPAASPAAGLRGLGLGQRLSLLEDHARAELRHDPLLGVEAAGQLDYEVGHAAGTTVRDPPRHLLRAGPGPAGSAARSPPATQRGAPSHLLRDERRQLTLDGGHDPGHRVGDGVVDDVCDGVLGRGHCKPLWID